MNLLSVNEIKNILSKYDATPSKRLGQNFLIDKNVLEKIIRTADLKPDDIVLEVGPGIGTLTQELAKTAGRVIAIEKDRRMIEILKEIFDNRRPSIIKDYKNIDIIHGDILKIEPLDFARCNSAKLNKNYKIKNYKVVANIPYYLTSPVIRKFLETENQPRIMVLMVQKEVAQRICSKPPNMSLLSVSVQFYAEPKIISYVSKNCFWPSPKVDSAIIKITPSLQNRRSSIMQRSSVEKKQVKEKQVDVDLFFHIVKAGFSHPRKQLVNNLSTLKSLNGAKLTKDEISDWLLKNNLKPEQRAETLNVKDWINLTKFYKAVL